MAVGSKGDPFLQYCSSFPQRHAQFQEKKFVEDDPAVPALSAGG